MAEALAFARIAYAEQEVPIGAVVVRDGRMIGRGRNRRERLADPTHHAEIEAIREAAREVGHWRLEDCTLYATLEPCPMCAGAAVNARIRRIVFGCHGPQGRILRHPRQHPGGRAAEPPAAGRGRPSRRGVGRDAPPVLPGETLRGQVSIFRFEGRTGSVRPAGRSGSGCRRYRRRPPS